MTPPGPARIAAPLAVAALALAAPGALAGGINHFEAAPGPHNYIVTQHPAVLRHLVPSAWLVLSYAHDPLVFRNADGDEVQKIVEHQVNAEIAAALGLFDRFEIGLVLPGIFVTGPGFDNQGLTEVGTGDVRVTAKALLTPNNEGLVASFRLQSDLIPIAQLNANAGTIAGETIPNVTPAFSVGFNADAFRVGTDVGVIIRAPHAIGNEQDALTVGSEVRYGVGGELAILPRTLFVTADLAGSVAPEFFGSSQTEAPLEVNGALKWFTGPVVLMLGAGTGLVPGYGAPDVRVFAAVGYYERGIADKDFDGILDPVDACPEIPEDKDGYQDEDGCPDADNDGDGILDADDQCRDVAEDIDRWQDGDGCPEADNDADGIEDAVDECPNDPEVKNGFEDDDGCPDEAGKKKLVVVRREKIEINDKIFFAYDSDRILPRSYPLLDDVAGAIIEHTEIPAIFIEGHTDSDGPDAYNLKLSDRRAKSVRQYLVDKGVAEERLEAKGFGETKPVADNATEDGKAENRRVEFRIIELAPASPPPASPPPASPPPASPPPPADPALP